MSSLLLPCTRLVSLALFASACSHYQPPNNIVGPTYCQSGPRYGTQCYSTVPGPVPGGPASPQDSTPAR